MASAQTPNRVSPDFQSFLICPAVPVPPVSIYGQRPCQTEVLVIGAQGMVEPEVSDSGADNMTAPAVRWMPGHVQSDGQDAVMGKAQRDLQNRSTDAPQAVLSAPLQPGRVEEVPISKASVMTAATSRDLATAQSHEVAPERGQGERTDVPDTPHENHAGRGDDPTRERDPEFQMSRDIGDATKVRPVEVLEDRPTEEDNAVKGFTALPGREIDTATGPLSSGAANLKAAPAASADTAPPRAESPNTRDGRPAPDRSQLDALRPHAGQLPSTDAHVSERVPTLPSSELAPRESLPSGTPEALRGGPTPTPATEHTKVAPLHATERMGRLGAEQLGAVRSEDPGARSTPGESPKHRFEPEDMTGRASASGGASDQDRSRVTSLQAQEGLKPRLSAPVALPPEARQAEPEPEPQEEADTRQSAHPRDPTNAPSVQSIADTRAQAQIRDAPTLEMEVSLAPAGEDALADVRHEPASTTLKDPLPAQAARHLANPDAGRLAVEQVTAAVKTSRDGVFDIQLAPDELGRVRLSMTHVETELVITISAERSETLDLMRRNIDLLARDFREQGFTSMQFGFEQGENRGTRSGARVPPEPGTTGEHTEIQALPQPRSNPPARTGASGLDLRL